MTAVVKEAEGSKVAEEKTLDVSPLNQSQLDMVTKFYQHVQLTKTTALMDADVIIRLSACSFPLCCVKRET